jgi:hypothetical protein
MAVCQYWCCESAPPPLAFTDICTADAVVYGLGEEAPADSALAESGAESSEEPGTSSVTSYGLNTPLWMVALVVGVPLLLVAGWLLQTRKRVS